MQDPGTDDEPMRWIRKSCAASCGVWRPMTRFFTTDVLCPLGGTLASHDSATAPAHLNPVRFNRPHKTCQPPALPKTSQTPTNTGDIYFPNLAYSPHPTRYHRSSPRPPSPAITGSSHLARMTATRVINTLTNTIIIVGISHCEDIAPS